MVLPLALLGLEGLTARQLLGEFLTQAAGAALGGEGGEGVGPSAPPQLNVEVQGIDAAIARLDSMTTRLNEFPIDLLVETQAWEVEDVHRQTPRAEQTMDGVEVVFFARGNSKRATLASRYQIRRSRLLARRAFYSGQSSTRPVLRAELLDRLIARLDRLMADTLQW
jgi:hypothetical protein